MDTLVVAPDDNYDSFDEQNSDDRPTERWAPLGASVSPAPSTIEGGYIDESEQLRQLEEQQEQLNSYLQSLTTHFAQVQFRLKQTVNAPPEEKEVLLKELEQLAFQGVPDVIGCITDEDLADNDDQGEKLSAQREKQKELISKLKTQLEDLEMYAYETGEAGLPTNQMMQKQRVIIDQLKSKLDLNLENFDHLSTEQLKEVVDEAIGQIVNPAKVKGKLVEQLKTQITDLERFIQFLQGEVSSPGPLGKERCTCTVHGGKNTFATSIDSKGTTSNSSTSSSHTVGLSENETNENLRQTTLTLMKKALALLQVFAITQFGCGGQDFQRNLLKRTAKANHWGDLRARLELSIDKVLLAAAQQEASLPNSSDFDSESEEDQLPPSSQALTQVVRKDLAMSIRDLMQHGLVELGQSNSLVMWGCFPNRSAAATKLMHAWDLLLKFYEMKHGKEYNESPARKLSQSFHLDIVGGKPITAKQTLLGAIDTVIQTHTPLKRTEDSHFKAFICLALNEKKLVTWLKLLFRTQFLVDYYYQDWSYVARTGFDDALKSLDRLNVINFKLAADIAVRPFSKIKDAF